MPGSFSAEASVKNQKSLAGRIRKLSATGLCLLAGSAIGFTQTVATPPAPPPDAMTEAVRQLQDEVRELRNAVVELRSEAGQYRAETEQLRKELQARGPAQEAAAATPDQSSSNAAQPAPLGERVSSLEVSSQLLSRKLDDQYLTKVEAAS